MTADFCNFAQWVTSDDFAQWVTSEDNKSICVADVNGQQKYCKSILHPLHSEAIILNWSLLLRF